jgi:hypothetical protein
METRRLSLTTREKIAQGLQSRWFLIGLAAAALMVRLGVVVVLETYTTPYHYSEHVAIARNILAGRGYSYDWYGLGSAGDGSAWTPLYVGAVLAAHTLSPVAPWLALQVFQALVATVTVVLGYAVGRQLFGAPAGALAGLWLAVYPPALGYVLDIQSLTLETALVVSAIWAMVRFLDRPSWTMAGLIGLLVGLVTLSRSHLLFWLPVLIGIEMIRRRWPVVSRLGLALGVALMVVAPWMIRNYLVHGTFVFVSTNGGITMFLGNNSRTTGTAIAELNNLWEWYPDLARELAPLREVARDRRLYAEAWAFIQTHPFETAGLALKKLYYFWWFKPDFAVGGVASGYPWYYGLAYVGAYVPVLILGGLGVVRSWRRWRELTAIYVLFALQTAVSVVYIAGTRYRGILEPLLIIFSAFALVQLFGFLYSRRPARQQLPLSSA